MVPSLLGLGFFHLIMHAWDAHCFSTKRSHIISNGIDEKNQHDASDKSNKMLMFLCVTIDHCFGVAFGGPMRWRSQLKRRCQDLVLNGT